MLGCSCGFVFLYEVIQSSLSKMWQLYAMAVVLALTPILTLGQQSSDPDELLHWCLDAQNHKSKPGPEAVLYRQCTPWKDRSCCTFNTTQDAHHTNMYNFNYNHCSHIKNMSEDCKRHFQQDLCFYECSPNIGPWVVKVDMKIRKERFHKVPLCHSDSKSWFNACIDDYTCTDNWGRNWEWSKTGNKCLPNAECKTFKEIFGNEDNFVNRIWDEAWDSTPDDKPCMRLWFDGDMPNPNDNVAKFRVNQLIAQGLARRSAAITHSALPVIVFISIFALLI